MNTTVKISVLDDYEGGTWLCVGQHRVPLHPVDGTSREYIVETADLEDAIRWIKDERMREMVTKK